MEALSRHVDLLRRGYAAWNRGDIGGVLAMTHPDFQWVEPPGVIDASGGRGRREFGRYLRGFLEVWDELRWEPEEFHGRGDLLFVVVRELGRGRLSGATVEQRFMHVWTLRDGKSVRMERRILRSSQPRRRRRRG